MLQLFDKYFLTLVLIQGLVVRFIDYNTYRLKKQDVLSKIAKLVSSGVIIIAVILFFMGRTIE